GPACSPVAQSVLPSLPRSAVVAAGLAIRQQEWRFRRLLLCRYGQAASADVPPAKQVRIFVMFIVARRLKGHVWILRHDGSLCLCPIPSAPRKGYSTFCLCGAGWSGG